MGRTLPPRSDAPRPSAAKNVTQVKHLKAAKREPAATARAGTARGRTGTKPLYERGRRSSRKTISHRTAADRELALRMLEALMAGSDVRARKVRRLKAAIKVRAYENELKFQVAFDRMLGT